jgi:tRNA threonylcarbamoyladenosine biosynthesis protein TsaB
MNRSGIDFLLIKFMPSPTSLVLGIDTSTAWSSLGLVDDSGLLLSHTHKARRGHGKGLMNRIEALLESCGGNLRDLTGLGVVKGPGSFTSLRVGVSTAEGLSLALGIPLVPCGTLEAIAAGLPSCLCSAWVLVPARSGEVFAQVFRRESGIGGFSESVIDCVSLDRLTGLGDPPDLVTGPAVTVYWEECRALFGSERLAPEPLRYVRGEIVASLALEKIRQGQAPAPESPVVIDYLQSHGALTIEERQGLKP